MPIPQVDEWVPGAAVPLGEQLPTAVTGTDHLYPVVLKLLNIYQVAIDSKDLLPLRTATNSLTWSFFHAEAF
jgi:hypothetical protein